MTESRLIMPEHFHRFVYGQFIFFKDCFLHIVHGVLQILMIHESVRWRLYMGDWFMQMQMGIEWKHFLGVCFEGGVAFLFVVVDIALF